MKINNPITELSKLALQRKIENFWKNFFGIFCTFFILFSIYAGVTGLNINFFFYGILIGFYIALIIHSSSKIKKIDNKAISIIKQMNQEDKEIARTIGLINE